MPILKANKIKLAKAQAEARLNTLAGWRAAHAGCPRGGPKVETRVHVYDYWLCTCGDRFIDPPRTAATPGSVTWTLS